jgi:hypothetical protein
MRHPSGPETRNPTTQAAAWALEFDGCITNAHEAPVIGNGDLAACVLVFQNELRLQLGKNDIWDARFDFNTAKAIYPQEKLIRASRDYGFRLENLKPVWDKTPPPDMAWPDDDQGFKESINPCPKPAGWLRVLHSGISSTKIHTRIDIVRGLVTSRWTFDNVWHSPGTLTVEAFIDRDANVARVRVSRQGNVGRVMLVIEKPPDALDPSIPPPAVELLNDDTGVISQTIPGGSDIAAFTWHLAGAFAARILGQEVGRVERHVHRLSQPCLPNNNAGFIDLCVGVATDRDGPGSSDDRAISLARDARNIPWDSALQKQEESWSSFWAKSGIQLQDKALEAAWHRDLFALACHIPHTPHAQAPGLCANVVGYEKSPWHGLYTVNMNIQKMFIASLPSNHPEWIDSYAHWLQQMTPGFEEICRLTFGFEGVYSPHMVLPYVPAHHQFATNTCGRSLGMTGWHGEPLWRHWEHTRDIHFLRHQAYPYLKRAACFYLDYLARFSDDSGDYFPTMNLEMPPWTRGFRHNRDCYMDVILSRAALMRALDAAQVLGVDQSLQSRWLQAINRFRPLRHERAPDGTPWIAQDKNDSPPTQPGWQHKRENRWSIVAAAWSVFPGEYVAGDELPDEPGGPFARDARDLMRQANWATLHPEVTWIHHWWCAIPALRMGLPDAFDHTRQLILKERYPAGHARTTHWINMQPDAWRCPEDNYLGVAATTEMLLQSHGGVLRLFPCWPRDQSASFWGLSARGGFEVDSTWNASKGLGKTRILSRADVTCRLRWENPTLPDVTCNEQPVKAIRSGRDMVFETQKGFTYWIT